MPVMYKINEQMNKYLRLVDVVFIHCDKEIGGKDREKKIRKSVYPRHRASVWLRFTSSIISARAVCKQKVTATSSVREWILKNKARELCIFNTNGSPGFDTIKEIVLWILYSTILPCPPGRKTGRTDTNCIECHVSLDVAISFGIQRHRPVFGTIAARDIEGLRNSVTQGYKRTPLRVLQRGNGGKR